MAQHQRLSLATELDVFFAHPHSPWERGTNENTNRLLREYFPKSTEITSDSAYHNAVAAELNARPVVSSLHRATDQLNCFHRLIPPSSIDCWDDRADARSWSKAMRYFSTDASSSKERIPSMYSTVTTSRSIARPVGYSPTPGRLLLVARDGRARTVPTPHHGRRVRVDALGRGQERVALLRATGGCGRRPGSGRAPMCCVAWRATRWAARRHGPASTPPRPLRPRPHRLLARGAAAPGQQRDLRGNASHVADGPRRGSAGGGRGSPRRRGSAPWAWPGHQDRDPSRPSSRPPHRRAALGRAASAAPLTVCYARVRPRPAR